MNDSWTENDNLQYRAVELGLVSSVLRLPSHMRDKNVGLKALKDDRYDWSFVTKRFKKDFDYLLVKEPTREAFTEAMSVITDKEKLSKWAIDHAQSPAIPREYWSKQYLPAYVFKDKSALIRIVKASPSIVGKLDKSLMGHSFLQLLIDPNANVLFHIPKLETDLTKAAWQEANLAKLDEDFCTIERYIPQMLWKDVSFVLGWIRCGGKLVD